MSPTLAVVLWWVAFAGAHLLLSSLPVRRRLIAGLGQPLFQGLYSVVVLGLFIPLLLVYFGHKHEGPQLWVVTPGPVLRWLLYVGLAFAAVLVVGSQITPSPSNLVPGAATPRGVLRITRHPFIMGTVLWALLHLVPNGSGTDVAFFGGFVAFGLVGARHQDARKIATGVPGYREFCAATPFLPFVGPGARPGLVELAPAVVLGVALTVVLRYYHAAWFGS
jgi:uncharacterized membrane protein